MAAAVACREFFALVKIVVCCRGGIESDAHFCLTGIFYDEISTCRDIADHHTVHGDTFLVFSHKAAEGRSREISWRTACRDRDLFGILRS